MGDFLGEADFLFFIAVIPDAGGDVPRDPPPRRTHPLENDTRIFTDCKKGHDSPCPVTGSWSSELGIIGDKRPFNDVFAQSVRVLSFSFFRFPCLAVNFLVDDPVGNLGEVGTKGLGNLLKLRPKHRIDETAGRPDERGLTVHARIAVRLQTVTAAKRGKQFELPRIGYGKPYLGFFFLMDGFPQTLAYALSRQTGGCSLALGARAREQIFNFPQLFAKRLLGCHELFSSPSVSQFQISFPMSGGEAVSRFDKIGLQIKGWLVIQYCFHEASEFLLGAPCPRLREFRVAISPC